MASFVQDTGINHGRSHVFVPHQLLDGPDVVPGFKQMSGKRMSEGVAANVLDYASFADSLLHSPLENRLMDAVPTFLASPDVLPPVLLGKDPLPAPVRGSFGILASQGIWHLYAAPSFA